MSDNPFASPLANDPHEPVKQVSSDQRPGALSFLLIACLILGALGLATSLLGVAMLAFQSTITEMQGQADPMTVKMQEMQEAQFWPNLIQIGLNLVIVAPMLMIGSIGCLMRKGWAYGFMKLSLLVAAAFILLRAVIGTIIQISMLDEMQEAMQSAMQQQGGGQAAEMAGTFMRVGSIVGIVFGAVFALAVMGFYLWGWFYMKKEKVQAHFGVNPDQISV